MKTDIGDRVQFALVPVDDPECHRKVNDFLSATCEWQHGAPTPYFDGNGRAYIWCFCRNPDYDVEQNLVGAKCAMRAKREVEAALTRGVMSAPSGADKRIQGPRLMPS